MSEENAQVLLQLLKVLLRTGDNEEKAAANQQIIQLLTNSETIFVLFIILQKCPDYTFRRMALILIRQSFKNLITFYNIEQMEQLKQMLFNIILNEQDFQFRIELCEIINVLILEKKLPVQWNDVYEFANSLLQNENLFNTGLYLWSIIIVSLKDDALIQAANFLIEICINAMNRANPDSLIYGTNLLQTIFWETWPKMDFSGMVESISELLLNVLRKAFYVDQNPSEAKSIVKSVIEILSVPNNKFGFNFVFEEVIIFQFAKLGIEIMSHEELSLDLRLEAYGLIENDIENSKICEALLDGILFSTVQEYFTLFIKIMVQLLQIQQEDTRFDFAGKFFHNAGATIEGSDVFIFIFRTASELAENGGAIGAQVGLFLLYSIVESQQEYFSEHIELVIDYIIKYANCDDDCVLTYAFRLLQEIAEYIAPALTTKINSIAAFLLNRVTRHECLRTLDIVLNASLHPPSDVLLFLQTLINFIPQANNEMISELLISCVGSTISKSFYPVEEVFGMICPILDQALASNNSDLQKVALKCFGNLSLMSPRSTAAEMEKIATILMSFFKETVEKQDIVLLFEVIICLRKICQNLPISLGPYFDGFVQILFTLLQTVYPIRLNDGENDGFSDSDISLVQSELLLCVSSFIRAYPERMAESSETFYQMLSYAHDHMTIPICSSIKVAASGFKALGKSPFPIFNLILNQLRNSDNVETIYAIHVTLHSLMISCRDQIDEDLAKSIYTHLLNGIGGDYTQGYLMYELSESLHIKLIPPIFHCLIQLIDILGPNIDVIGPNGKYSENIDAIVEQYLSSPSKYACGLATEVYAKLASVSADGPIYFEIAMKSILVLIEEKRIEMHECLTRSLRYLICATPQPFVGKSQKLIAYSENILKLISTGVVDSEDLKYSNIALWFSFIMKLGLAPGEEPFNIAMSGLPPPPSNENIPTIAVFMSFAMKQFPSPLIQAKLPYVAASVLASEESIILKIPQNIIAEFIAVLTAVPRDNLIELVRFNEAALMKMLSNLTKFMPAPVAQ